MVLLEIKKYNVWLEDILNEMDNKNDAGEEKITKVKEIAVNYLC